MTLTAVFLTSDVERHRTVSVVVVTIMFFGAALDLVLWTRRHRPRARDASQRA